MQQLEGPDTELRASEISGLFGPKFRPPDMQRPPFTLGKSYWKQEKISEANIVT